MNIGICTWIFGNDSLATIAARLERLGYDGVELAGKMDSVRTGEVKRILKDHGLQAFSLTPENVDLAHPDRTVWNQAIDYYKRLLDFGAELGAPIVCCHGAVGRVRAMSSYEEEWGLYVGGVRRIAEKAETMGLKVAMELLNRYEAHLLQTVPQAVRFIEEVGSRAVGILLDTYHMNIEEADPAGAVVASGGRLSLFHAADSNRKAVGRGHTDFPALLHALFQVGYGGPIVVECTASGPDPFSPEKGEGWRDEVWRYAEESLKNLRRLTERVEQEGTASS